MLINSNYHSKRLLLLIQPFFLLTFFLKSGSIFFSGLVILIELKDADQDLEGINQNVIVVLSNLDLYAPQLKKLYIILILCRHLSLNLCWARNIVGQYIEKLKRNTGCSRRDI